MLHRLKQFLGLEKKVDKEKITSIFKARYAIFNDLLQSNSHLATTIANMEATLRGERNADANQIRKDARQAIVECERMVNCLNDISEHRYGDLVEAVSNLGQKIETELEQHTLGDVKDLTLALSDIDASLTYAVGGKSANLGEILNVLNIKIPDGFAITIQAGLLHLLSPNGLFKKIHAILRSVDPDEPSSAGLVSREVQDLIMSVKVPDEVQEAIYKQWELAFGSKDVVCAMRSSAIAEDGVQSFAGQYATILGVRKKNLLPAFKEIVASLFSERALSYRSSHGFRLEASGMGVLCLEMVQAYAAGVAYSRHPIDLRSNCVLINGVFGLGEMVVDGSATPDMWLYGRTSQKIELAKIATKTEQIILDVSGENCHQVRTAVNPKIQNEPCLTTAQVEELAQTVLLLERHYQYPQDVEWAIDQDGQLLILQTRPLRMESADTDLDSPELDQLQPLAKNGDCMARGVAAGPVVPFAPEEVGAEFPKGGIMLLKHSSPLAMVGLRNAAAVIAETGSMTGHMAILCREFGVPCIANLPGITQKLTKGQVVTVDALAGRVFQGEIPELLSLAIKKEAPKEDTPALMLLKRVAPLILPLHLVDPNSELFQPKNCTSLHDCMRYAHEFSYDAMFKISDDLANGSNHEAASKLISTIPLDLYVIDLGGGMANQDTRSVKPEEILSLPFKELLAGMLDPAVQAKGPRPIDMKGFLSVMGQSMIGGNNRGGERFGDHSYAIISDRYLMLSSRVGYHYAVLDTWCGNTINKNYIRFEFSGGAASNERKARRIRCIAIILNELGFTVETEGTRLKARFQKYAKEAIQERLIQMGRLLIMTRQLDMLMVDEASVQRFAANFLEGRYH